jgi:hypothetical protein
MKKMPLLSLLLTFSIVMMVVMMMIMMVMVQNTNASDKKAHVPSSPTKDIKDINSNLASDSGGSDSNSSPDIITTNTSIADLPGEVEGNRDLTVGTMLSGCSSMVNRGDAASVKIKSHCDNAITFVVNYCLAHMNDTMALENKQVCWDSNSIESGLKYAVAYLDAGTALMLKAQSEITNTRHNAYKTLPREILIEQCENNIGFRLPQELRDTMKDDALQKCIQ